MHLLESSQYIALEVLKIEKLQNADQSKKLTMPKLINQCNFIVIAAACAEAHLNWYYFHDKGIDVDEKVDGKFVWHTGKKIKKSPLSLDTQGATRAIFKLRNQVMHPKYEPRDPKEQYNYNSYFMLHTFKTLVNICKELLEACPSTLAGRIAISKNQIKLADSVQNLVMKDKNGKSVNWVETINNNRVGLPMMNVVDVPKRI